MSPMRRALALARRAVGIASPNPPVGAVVVRAGEVVGEGWTGPPGHPHAEVVALRAAGARAAGAELYTTLEPCSHFGRTPPCVLAILESRVARIHAATIDPNPLVNGQGLAALRAAGVETLVGDGAPQARALMEAYAKHITTGVPFVTAKFAMSLDGKIATASGDSRWITGPAARRRAHHLRAAADAIMVGVNTVLRDDPRLTARRGDGTALARQPLRVVVDSRGHTPPAAALLHEPGHTLIATALAAEAMSAALAAAGAEVVALPWGDGRVDLDALLRCLGRRGVTSVLVEGGGTLLGSLFDRRLVDKVVAFVAPAIIGGAGAPTPVAGVGVELASQALRLVGVKIARADPDAVMVGYCEDQGVHWNR